ncbi:MAG: ASKHA domain-containing protein [Synergistaceae bacterium]|jgi:uncharacterized 2Fe-2S/4Fe-4S cluster protein (DUF4445 family)|nr:ASKHA domain-containing protein [Synergistaceae bacterium]
MPRVRFKNQGVDMTVEEGTTILDAARSAGLSIETPCNAIGLCRKCRIMLSRPEQIAGIVSLGPPFTETDGTHGDVLACQSAIYGDVELLLENYADKNRSLRILSKGHTFSYDIRPFISKRFDGTHTKIIAGDEIVGEEDGDTTMRLYGIVIDVGTTTLVSSLIDLVSGAEVAAESAINPQSAYAQDVLARINFASKNDGMYILHKAFIDSCQAMLSSMSKKASIDLEQIYEVVLSGNTTMLHLACGLDPSPLGRYPYVSRLRGDEYLPAVEFGVSPFGLIYLPPVISAFIGADITSGVLASQLAGLPGITLFIDIGTNGEIVLANDGTLSATSAAAGPAFEGMNIVCGMRASSGAIETFKIAESGDSSYSVIGGGDAVGICGSGILDVAGELVRVGIVDKNGRFAASADREPLKRALRKVEGKPAFFITDEVYFTQHDARQIQLAKGAIRAGIEALLSKLGVNANSTNRVLIAGSFGYHLSEESLLNIALLPRHFAGKINFIGNTSQSGGIAFLLNADFRKSMRDIVKRIDKVELSNEPGFEKLFVQSLRF